MRVLSSFGQQGPVRTDTSAEQTGHHVGPGVRKSREQRNHKDESPYT
jgi:hypothetical protein